MKNNVQLITYVDRLGGPDLKALNTLLTGPLKGVFGGVHLLPFFYPVDGEDAGFDPIDHTRVDPKVGDWAQLKSLSQETEVMADLIVNHISADSDQFKDLVVKGRDSAYTELFLTLGSIFPDGATEDDLACIYRPRPGIPFTTITLGDGSKRLFWTTFTPKQIDINVLAPAGWDYLTQILTRFQENGIRMIRMDAVGYAIKTPGTNCFMTDETFAFIRSLTQHAHKLGIEVLVEIHSYYQKQIEIAAQVDWVYDFALPPLILHTLYANDAKALKNWLRISPRNAITVLDTHDGIGIVDVGAGDGPGQEEGLLQPDEIESLVETIHKKSKGTSRKATGVAASNLDLYQVNCTYYDALGKNDKDYLLARIIQFFSPGIPQVYYVGLLAGENDMDLLAETGVGRDINRHYYSQEEVQSHLERPVVQHLINLIKFRNTHPAFQGTFSLPDCEDSQLIMRWENGKDTVTLTLDLPTREYRIQCTWEEAMLTINNPFEFTIPHSQNSLT